MEKSKSVFETLSLFLAITSVLLFSFNQLWITTSMNAIWFIIFALIIFISSMTLCFRCFQSLLDDSSPISYRIAPVLERYPFIKSVIEKLPKINLYPDIESEGQISRKDVNLIANNVEKKLVSSWFHNYISDDNEFPDSCKELLEHAIAKLIQIADQINNTNFINNCLIILLCHIIEYQEALSKQEKNPLITLAEAYKRMHPTSQSNSVVTKEDHCKEVSKTILKELIPIEIIETTQAALLSNAISKKMFDFINDVTEPSYIFGMIDSCISDGTTPNDTSRFEENCADDTLKVQKYTEKAATPKEAPRVVESVLNDLLMNTTAPILHNAVEVNAKNGCSNESIDISSSSIPIKMRQKQRNPLDVKIHSKYSNLETWVDDVDLASASLGQDLLASLDGEMRLESRLSGLWELDSFEFVGDDISPRVSGEVKSPDRLWFGEEEMTELNDCQDKSPQQPHGNKVRTEPSTSNILMHLQKDIKDLQTTVSQAKNKIGDIQDEAAGMIEGILDFGIAGIKKGLHITGLQESPTQPRSEREFSDTNSKSPKRPSSSDDKSPRSSKIAMLKVQPHVASEDSDSLHSEKILSDKSPGLVHSDIVEELLKSESPEPEYEDPADLTTAIAKLRSLLQERTSDQSINSETSTEAWWEQNDADLGNNDLPMHASVIPANASGQNNNNNMQRFDRLLQRTVTGVFNSLKSAVGGTEEGGCTSEESSNNVTIGVPADVLQWRYVVGTFDLGDAMERFVARRRCVEAAEDTLRTLTPINNYAEDEFECWRILVELVSALGKCSHVFTKIASRLLPEPLEPILKSWYKFASVKFKTTIVANLKNLSSESKQNGEIARKRVVNPDDLCEKIKGLFPKLLTYALGDLLSVSITTLIRSFEDKQINIDFTFQLLDVAALMFVKAANSPVNAD